jgi:hypothetical protein
MEGVRMTPVEIAVATVVYAGVEYWLGRTDKVKAGSVLEFVLLGLKGAASVFVGKGKK